MIEGIDVMGGIDRRAGMSFTVASAATLRPEALDPGADPPHRSNSSDSTASHSR